MFGFKFRLNDTVQFTQDDGHLYRIVGYRLEKGFYSEESWTHVVYELFREFDDYRMDAEEEELVKVVRVEDSYYKIHDVCGYRYPVKVRTVHEETTVQVQLDNLLDRYNDFKALASLFQDESYEQRAEDVVMEMKRIVHDA